MTTDRAETQTVGQPCTQKPTLEPTQGLFYPTPTPDPLTSPGPLPGPVCPHPQQIFSCANTSHRSQPSILQLLCMPCHGQNEVSRPNHLRTSRSHQSMTLTSPLLEFRTVTVTMIARLSSLPQQMTSKCCHTLRAITLWSVPHNLLQSI